MDFSEFVKKVRKDLKVSQVDLAKALNVNFTTINRWENNRVVPSNLAMKSLIDYCQNNFIDIPEELLKQSE
ncbi:MAG: helix-turn-helix domain-containing protein [Lachnospiraceae bacterium]|nr:helix-turn-helix domain-containing protein [Lachnospiraceae bacterium]